MAARCHTPRRQTTSAPSVPHQQSRTSDQQFYTDLAGSSTYIFPHPSSAPPSPTRSPFPSDTSDISFSTISISNYDSPKSTLHLSPDGHFNEYSPAIQPPPSSSSPLNLWTDGRGVSWNLDNSSHLDSILLGADVQTLGNTRFKVPRKPSLSIPITASEPGSSIIPVFRHPLARVSTSPTPPPHLDKVQQHRVPLVSHLPPHSSIPLLSFFASLLYIEDSTVALIISPTPSPSSFPTDALVVEKLLSAIASESGFRSVRRGMRTLDEYSHGEFTLMTGLWDIVTELLWSGRKALFN